MHRCIRRAAALIALGLPLGGCTVGPKYVRPPAEVPPAYKEAASPGFTAAQPSAAQPKGKWWEIYADPELSSLEDKVTAANQDLKAAQAKFAQARAAVQVARAAYYPTVSGGASASRTRQSENKALVSTSSKINYNDFQLPIDASWEPDVWGRVRRTVEAARSEAQASAADLAGVDLSLHAELALDYFELRGLDTQKQLLDSTVVAY
ncbi:MAG: TolC family protein, partial [Candidatus Acidiferrales bacterium]